MDVNVKNILYNAVDAEEINFNAANNNSALIYKWNYL